MNLEVFCYIGLLKFREQLEPSCALLPEGQRQQTASFLATAKDLPREELLERWSRQREDEYVAMRQHARERTGIELDELPLTFRQLCASWLIEGNE